MKFLPENYKNFYGKTEDESSYGEPAKIVKGIPRVLESGTVLDLGAGDGRHAIFLAEHGFEVTAVDLSEDGLEKLRRLASQHHVRIATQLADLSSWSIPQDYDAMVIVQTLQHLQTKDALRLMEEVKTHTRPNGVNAISLFINEGDRYLMDRDEDPGAFYPEAGWLQTFYDGWEIIESGSYNGVLTGQGHPDGTPKMSVTERILARKPA